MNELRWTELAAHVVAWHNRHPLSRHISVQHVHSLGYVMLPFVDAGAAAAAPAGAPRDAASGQEPLPPEAVTGSLRERAMARAQLEAQGAAARPDDSPPSPATPARLRPGFDEDFIPPFSAKAVRRWAARQAVTQNTPRGDVQVRKVRAEAGLSDHDLHPRWVLTAQIEVGRARTRVLVGPGLKPAVLGRRLISPGRTLALFALAGVLAGVASWVLDREPAAAPRAAASAPASGATAVPPPPGLAAASAGDRVSVAVVTPAPSLLAASAPSAATDPSAASATGATASAVAPTLEPLHAERLASGPSGISHQRPKPPASAASSGSAAAADAAVPAASAPVDVEPRLGRVELPSLGPRIDARRRRVQEAAASAAANGATTPATPTTPAHSAAAPVPGGPSFAVTTRLLRTRSESEQLAAAIRELLSKQAGPPVRVEVLAAGDDWRVVGWPYTDRDAAEKARALLAARGMKVQVVDF